MATIVLGGCHHEPALPANREQKYSVAVLEVHMHSFHASPALPAPAMADGGQRQLEGPAEAEAA